MRLNDVEGAARSADDARHDAPVPWGSSLSVRGRTSELHEILAYVADALGHDGWELVSPIQDPPPLGAVTLRRGDEQLSAVLSPGPPARLRRPAEYELNVTGRVRCPAAIHAVVAAVPFTDYELESIRHDMPLTASIEANAERWLPELAAAGPVRLDGHGAIFTIHHQTDFLLLLEKALDLGLDRSLVTVIDKEYRYAHARRVDAHVRRRLGVPVFTYSDLRKGLKDHIRRVREAQRQAGEAGLRPTLVVDDGGYVLPVLLRDFEPFLNLFKGVVEQTTSGIWRLRPYADLKVPVFSVAESELKASVEAHGVAAAGVANLRRLFPNEHFGGRRAVVVGFGVIGEALAGILREHRCQVYVSDTDPARVAAAQERGYQASLTTVEAMRTQPRFVFACGRPGCVAAQELDALACDSYLVSVTSRDVAFDKQALAALGAVRPYGDIGTLYVDDARGRRLLLVADGFPINFHFAESMPNQQSDLVMASMLAGALELANARPAWPTGNDAKRANAVLNSGALLQDYLQALPRIGLPDLDAG